MSTFHRICTIVMILNAVFAGILAVDLAINGDYSRAFVGMAVCALSLALAYFAHDTRRKDSLYEVK